MLCLRVIGPETSRTMFFDKTSIHIGRVEGNDIVLPSPQVSKQHVQIIAKETSFLLIDVSSANGTSLNGSRVIGGIQIKINDEIMIGPYKLKILSSNFATEIPRPPSDPGLERKRQTEPIRPYIRKMLNFILQTDSQLDEFCVDYLPEIRQRISSGMDRTMKINLIIEIADLPSVQSIMLTSYTAKYRKFLAVNNYDG